MKYKLKDGKKGLLFLFSNIVLMLVLIGIIYSVVQYFVSINPNDPSELNYFIFVSVLVLMIVTKISYWLGESMKDIINLFEKKVEVEDGRN